MKALIENFRDRAVDLDPTGKLRRGLVQCRECKCIQKVNSAGALSSGWPKCCGYTMTLDVEEGDTDAA